MAVLSAEFDISRGSVLRDVYPTSVTVASADDDTGDVGADETTRATLWDQPLTGWTRHQLAELMLPEGVHHHQQDTDWTSFVINRNGMVLSVLHRDYVGSGDVGVRAGAGAGAGTGAGAGGSDEHGDNGGTHDDDGGVGVEDSDRSKEPGMAAG